MTRRGGPSREFPEEGQAEGADVGLEDVEGPGLEVRVEVVDLPRRLAVGDERRPALRLEVLLQLQVVLDPLGEHLLDEEEVVVDGVEPSDRAVEVEGVVGVDHQADLGADELADGPHDLDVAPEAGVLLHPLEAAADLDLEGAVAAVEPGLDLLHDPGDASIGELGLEVVEIDAAVVDGDPLGPLAPQELPGRHAHDLADQVVQGVVGASQGADDLAFGRPELVERVADHPPGDLRRHVPDADPLDPPVGHDPQDVVGGRPAVIIEVRVLADEPRPLADVPEAGDLRDDAPLQLIGPAGAAPIPAAATGSTAADWRNWRRFMAPSPRG